MNRILFQELAEDRAEDAEALLNAGQWSGVYYLSGYAVECGLKACIAKLTKEHDYPDKKFAQNCFTHDLEDLVKLAGLEDQRKARSIASPDFAVYWLTVKDSDEQSRYQRWTEFEARELFSAVTNLTNGVLPWIKGHW